MSDELTTTKPTSVLGGGLFRGFEPEGVWRLAAMACESGLAPKGMTPATAFLLIAYGAEFGISPIGAILGCSLIAGKLYVGADLLAAMARAKGVVFELESTDDKSCTYAITPPGGVAIDFTYSIEDARKAGLAGKENWIKQPAPMLRARCLSQGIRAVVPGLFTGLLVPEEAELVEREPREAPVEEKGKGVQRALDLLGQEQP